VVAENHTALLKKGCKGCKSDGQSSHTQKEKHREKGQGQGQGQERHWRSKV
jgi:hypothetical protein